MMKEIDKIPSEEMNKAIGQKVAEDPDVIYARCQSFMSLKKLIDAVYQEEIKLNTAQSRSGAKNFLSDPLDDTYFKGYLAGHHEGKMELLHSISEFIRIMECDIVPLLNKKYAKYQKEMMPKEP